MKSKLIKGLGATAGLGAAGGTGYYYGKKRGQEKLQDFSTKAVRGLRGQQRLINALVRRHRALGKAYMSQQKKLQDVMGQAKKKGK